MRNKKFSIEELEEIKRFVKEQSKKIKEGSTTAGVPGYQTPAAFTGKEGGDGTDRDIEDDQYAYSKKAPKEKPHFIKLHEVSYKEFKENQDSTQVQKVNRRILEINKMLGEISRYLDHSIKLKQESSLDNSKYWKRTNEAILKINKRLGEVSKKARKLANLKEIAATSLKQKIASLFSKAGIPVKPEDIDYHQSGTDEYELDVMINGEPYAIDYENGQLIYQDYDKEIALGNMTQEAEIIKMISKIFKA
jgi:hypothetical protein